MNNTATAPAQLAEFLWHIKNEFGKLSLCEAIEQAIDWAECGGMTSQDLIVCRRWLEVNH